MVVAAEGWTELVISPERPVRVVDGLITGWHNPDASHLLLVESVAGVELTQRAYDAAVAERYLWHEFGDSALLLPDHAAGRNGELGSRRGRVRTTVGEGKAGSASAPHSQCGPSSGRCPRTWVSPKSLISSIVAALRLLRQRADQRPRRARPR